MPHVVVVELEDLPSIGSQRKHIKKSHIAIDRELSSLTYGTKGVSREAILQQHPSALLLLHTRLNLIPCPDLSPRDLCVNLATTEVVVVGRSQQTYPARESCTLEDVWYLHAGYTY